MLFVSEPKATKSPIMQNILLKSVTIHTIPVHLMYSVQPPRSILRISRGEAWGNRLM